jgi:hypothetical protein
VLLIRISGIVGGVYVLKSGMNQKSQTLLHVAYTVAQRGSAYSMKTQGGPAACLSSLDLFFTFLAFKVSTS